MKKMFHQAEVFCEGISKLSRKREREREREEGRESKSVGYGVIIIAVLSVNGSVH